MPPKGQRALNIPQSGSSLITPTKTVLNQGRKILVRQPEDQDSQDFILLANSLGRAGSSWVGELLSQLNEETVYLFEPLRSVEKFHNITYADAAYNEILSDVFHCQMKGDMMELYIRYKRTFKNLTKKCSGNCNTLNDVNERCRKAKTIVVKVHITRLLKMTFDDSQ